MPWPRPWGSRVSGFLHSAAMWIVLSLVASFLQPPAPMWIWPVDATPAVVRDFDAPASEWGPGHRGLDLAARPGTTVRAPVSGSISFSDASSTESSSRSPPLTGRKWPWSRWSSRRSHQRQSVQASGLAWSPEATALEGVCILGFEWVISTAPPRESWVSSAGRCWSSENYARGWAWSYAPRRRSIDTWV